MSHYVHHMLEHRDGADDIPKCKAAGPFLSELQDFCSNILNASVLG
jgi:hypothetical protein